MKSKFQFVNEDERNYLMLLNAKLGLQLTLAFLFATKKQIRDYKRAFHYVKYKYRKFFPFILDTFTHKAYGAKRLNSQQFQDYIKSLKQEITQIDLMIDSASIMIKIGKNAEKRFIRSQLFPNTQAIVSEKHLINNN